MCVEQTNAIYLYITYCVHALRFDSDEAKNVLFREIELNFANKSLKLLILHIRSKF